MSKGRTVLPNIVLTYAYWHSHFQDDRGVVGRTVQLNKHPFTILGVTPPGFHGTILFFWTDFFVPMVNQAQVDGWNVPERSWKPLGRRIGRNELAIIDVCRALAAAQTQYFSQLHDGAIRKQSP
jgi:hypothetical protein